MASNSSNDLPGSASGLVVAAASGQTELVKKYIADLGLVKIGSCASKKSIDILPAKTNFTEARDDGARTQKSDAYTALSYAARNGHNDALLSLLQIHGITLESKSVDERESTPLGLAARHGHASTVRLLLSLGAKVDAIDALGRTALSWAASNGHAASVELLLQHCAEVNSEDKECCTPFSYAVMALHWSVVQLMLPYKPDAERGDAKGTTLLSRSCVADDVAVVEMLVQTKLVNVNHKDRETRCPILWSAAKNNSAPTIKAIIGSGKLKNIDEREGILDQTPLWYAASLGHTHGVRALLECGSPNLNWTDMYSSRTALTCAVNEGHASVVQALLEDGCVDLNIQDYRGQTALMLAATRRDLEIAQSLLEKGARIETQDANGRTALAYAAATGSSPLLTLLLKSRTTEREVVDRDGRTPLHLAAFYGRERAVETLLDIGHAFIDAQDECCCRTALSYAAGKGHDGVVRRLLERNADATIDDEYGHTALHYAEKNGHMKIVERFSRLSRAGQ